MHRTVLTVVALVFLAGCSLAGPTPSDGDPVQYNVTNLESVDATVEVGVVDEPVESLELTYANGTAESVAPPYIGEPTEIRSAILRLEAASLTVDGFQSRRSLQVAPRESATGEFSVSQGQTVVVVASVDGTVRAAGLMRCGDGERMNQVAFVVGGYGPLIGGGCQGG